MSYRVDIARSAQRALRRLPVDDAARIARAVAALRDNPRPPQSKKLAGGSIWRLRVGDYRVLYTIADRAQHVMVTRIARRTTTTYD